MSKETIQLPPIAILASGSGSTAEAYIRAWQENHVTAPVGLIVCSRPSEKAGIYQRVAQLNAEYEIGIPVVEIGPHTHPEGPAERGQTDEESEAITRLCIEEGIGLVALMGYRRIVRGSLLDEYGWRTGMRIFEARMINTHPGPLPETKDTMGIEASRVAKELGLTTTKWTAHVVSAEVDDGPVIAESEVSIEPSDTPEEIFRAVQMVEKAKLPIAIEEHLQLRRILN